MYLEFHGISGFEENQSYTYRQKIHTKLFLLRKETWPVYLSNILVSNNSIIYNINARLMASL